MAVIGCTSNNMNKHQAVTDKTRATPPTSNTAPKSKLMQASSISVTGSESTSIKMKQMPADTINRMDTFNPENGSLQNPVNPSAANQQQSTDSSQFAQQVLDLVNQERNKAGLNPLSMNNGLNKVAMAKAQDMYNNNFFDHQSPTYGSPFDMMKSFGITYNTAGENIAKGQTSPMEVMSQWMNSSGHRANILNSSFTQIGIAYYNYEWVQEFTG